MKRLLKYLFPKRPLIAVNIAEGTHCGTVTRLTDAAITTRYLCVKIGSDAAHIAVPTAITNVTLGICSDEASAAEAPVNVNLLGSSERTLLVTAGDVIAAGDLIAPMVGGKVQKAASTQFPIGRALNAAAADGLVEFDPIVPTVALA